MHVCVLVQQHFGVTIADMKSRHGTTVDSKVGTMDCRRGDFVYLFIRLINLGINDMIRRCVECIMEVLGYGYMDDHA